MFSLFVRLTVCVALLLCLALPAQACINDREVQNAEREFRSSYRIGPIVSPGELTSPANHPGALTVLLRTGQVLLVGALVVSLIRAR